VRRPPVSSITFGGGPLDKTMAICQLCRLEKKLIKAHIVPQSLYEPLREEGAPITIYPTAEGAFPKRAPSGIYDSTILCAVCDGKIGRWDDAAQRLLLAPLDTYGQPEEIFRRGIFEIAGFDYASLKLFFVSLLWRAHLTKHEFFAKVNLGLWAETARKMILNESPGATEDFAAILARYDHPLAVAMHNPQRIRFHGLNFYRFRLGQFIALIKVDQRKVLLDISGFCITHGRPIVVRVVDFIESEEFKLSAEAIERMNT
jgi:hypothetical protein